MKRAIGGRGYKLPFENRTVRMPEPLMGKATEMIERFYENDFKVSEVPIGLEEAVEKAREIVRHKKGAKSSLESLLKRLYGVDSIEL